MTKALYHMNGHSLSEYLSSFADFSSKAFDWDLDFSLVFYSLSYHEERDQTSPDCFSSLPYDLGVLSFLDYSSY